MKSLVVYYSLDGQTRRIADIIAKETGADIHELKPVRDTAKSGFSKFFLGGMHASFGSKTALREPLPALDSYDRVFIGTPVWASLPTPAVNTFLAESNLAGKKVLLFACSGGGNDAKCFDAMKKRLHGGSAAGQLGFAQSSKENPAETEARIKSWLAK